MDDLTRAPGHHSLTHNTLTHALSAIMLLFYDDIQFEDETATCVVSGEYNLQTQDCINYCFKKSLGGGRGSGSGGNGGSSGIGGIGGIFSSVFGGKK